MSRGLWFAMSAKTRRSLTLLWTALFLCSLAMQSIQLAAPTSVLAAHDEGIFELDGNAIDNTDPTTLPADWEDGAEGSLDEFFVGEDSEAPGKDVGYFTTGGSKDENDISSWAITDNSVPDKNELLDAYAAVYEKDGETWVYFGADRFDNDGTAQIGFWFFQDNVGISAGDFTGEHVDGDVLILSEYTNGGVVSLICAYTWDGSGGGDNISPAGGCDPATSGSNLNLVAAGAECDVAEGAFDICAVSNDTIETAPWPFLNKDNLTDFGKGQFFEGGINLSDMFGGEPPCFGTFLAETRSSAETDAQLKDFALGSLDTCVPPTITTLSSASTADFGDEVTDTATLSGTNGAVTGTVTFFICTPAEITAGVGCASGDPLTDGTQVGDPVLISDGMATSSAYTVGSTNAAIGLHCWRAEYEPAVGSDYLAAEHTNVTTECFTVAPGSIDWVKNGPNGTSLLGGATFSVTPNPLTGTGSLAVVDNGANDNDPTAGEFAINNARVGTYTVCETAAPSGYIIDTVCAEVTVSAADPTGTIAAGTFVNTLGSIEWVKVDGNDALLGGATFSVSPDPSDGIGTMTVVDNGPNDNDKTNGEFQVINVPTGTYTVTETAAPEGYDLDDLTCTIIVSAENPTGDQSCTFVDPAIPPAIRVVKTAGETAGTQVLDGLTYSTESFSNNTVYKYVVTNTGLVRLLNVTLTDDNGTPLNLADDFLVCPIVESLASGDSFTCTVTMSITADTTNVATVVGVSVGAGTEASDTDDAIVEIVGPAITLIKTAGASAGSQAPDGATYLTEVFTNNVTYSYLVTNTGEVTLNGITLSDDNGTVDTADDFAVTCPQATLAPAASMTCTAIRTISANRTNIATATGFTTQQPNTPITDTDDAVVVVQTPSINIVKTAGSAADGAVLQATPGNVTYTYVVTNTGPLPLQNVTVTDDNGTPANLADDFAATCPQTTLAPAASMTCTFTRNVTVDTTNIAVARGVTVNGNPAQDDDPAIVVIVVIDIVKTANDDLVEPNQVVTYTLNVKVVNGPLANAVVTDTLPVGQTFVAGSASPSQPSVSANGRTLTWTFANLATGDPALTITYNVRIDANATAARQVNVAQICIPTPALCDSDDEDVTPEFPAIVLVKTAGNAADGATFITEPGNVTYSYKVTNTGPLALSAVTVRDDNGTPTNTADDFSATCPKTTLAPAESMTCTFTRSVTVNTTNIAIARGVTVGGNPVQDDDPAVVRILVHGLLIDKTNNAPLVTLALPGGASTSLPTAREGTTVTFSLAWAFAGDPVSNGIITDVLPLGVTYVAGSATSVAPFTFQSYTAATRTLTWTAATVASSGSVSYQATIDLGASELAQPLVNVAAIASTQTARDTDDSQVFVPTVPLAATATPRITLPPTDGLAGTQAPSNPGFALMLILLVLAAVVLVVGFVTPVPASVRERPRR